jgi:hypothetical protein
MFSNIHDRFQHRGWKTKAISAALVCAAGLASVAGGTAVIAQIAGGNPTPNAETIDTGGGNPGPTSCDVQPACTITIPTTPSVVVPCYGSALGGVAGTAGTAQASGDSCGYIYVNIAGQLVQFWCPEAQIVGTCQVALAPARANAGATEGGAS